MDEQQKDRPDGLVITDDGGNYYYLRPDVLADAKMPQEDVEKLKAGLAKSDPPADRELNSEELETAAGGAGMMGGGQIPGVPKIPELGGIKISPTNGLARLPGGRGSSYSTVMCPW